MARFGQGINPALGAVDYTPYLQGSLAGAQMQAQGMSSLGQGIGAAVKNYYAKKEEKQALDTATNAVASFIKENPELGQSLGIKSTEDKGVLKQVVKTLGGAAPTLGVLNQFAQMREQQQDRQAIGIGLSAMQTGNMDPLAAIQAAGGRVSPGVAKFIADYQQMGAQTRKIGADADALANKRPEKVIDPVGIRSVGDNGEPIEVTVDRLSGQVVGRGPVSQPKYIRTPQEEAQATELKLRTEGAYKFNEELISAGANARTMARNIDQAVMLLANSGDGKTTGFGANVLLKLKQAGKQLGIDVGDVTAPEQLRVLFGDEVMSRVAQTKGAVSDREMLMFTDYSANFGNTPEGNSQILNFAKAAYERQQELSRLVRKLRREKKDEYEIQLAVEEFQDDNPLPTLVPPTRTGPRIISVEEVN